MLELQLFPEPGNKVLAIGMVAGLVCLILDGAQPYVEVLDEQGGVIEHACVAYVETWKTKLVKGLAGVAVAYLAIELARRAAPGLSFSTPL